MSAALGRITTERWREMSAEEAQDPSIAKKAAGYVPMAVSAGVSMASGSHIAGAAVSAATKAVIDSNPAAEQLIGKAARRVGEEILCHALVPVMIVALPVFLIGRGLGFFQDDPK